MSDYTDFYRRRSGLDKQEPSGPNSPTPNFPTTPANNDKLKPENNPSTGDTALTEDKIGDRSTPPPTAKPEEEQKKNPNESEEVNYELLRTTMKKDYEEVQFSDIKGQDQAVEEISEICDMVQYEDLYDLNGAEMPRGILLYGPPGTGKTMLATALANAAQTAYLSISCADIMSKFVGGPEKNASAIFDIAEQEAAKHPSGHAVLFLDEVEALLRSRDSDSHESSEKVLSIFLQRINGITKGGKITLVCATNRPDKLDTAFLSRMNAQIEVSLPDQKGRAEIFQSRLQKCQERGNKKFPDVKITYLDPNIDFEGIASLMVDKDTGEKVIGGRDLNNLANEIAGNRSKELVKLYKAWEQSQLDPADKEAAKPKVGKIKVNMEKAAELAKQLGPVTTETVIATAQQYSKTAFMFDKEKPVAEYMQELAERTAIEEDKKKKKDAGDKTDVGAPRYGLDPNKSREEARHELVDDLLKRIEQGDKEVLNSLYIENPAMPSEVQSVVSSFVADKIKKDEAVKLIAEMRDDDDIEPPHIENPLPAKKDEEAKKDAGSAPAPEAKSSQPPPAAPPA